MEDYRKKKVLVTGAAGFIGFNLCRLLLENNFIVFGIDNINDYYDVQLKFSRLNILGINQNEIKYGLINNSNVNLDFKFLQIDICDRDEILNLFAKEEFDYVCNLAAQAGVRYSIENPFIYVDSNVVGFINILEGCRQTQVKNLVYASTSSVYGLNKKMPLIEDDPTEHPMTLYAATKKANEMMAHSYSHLYNLPTIGLRFFTVYGPYGRPDMALFKFTHSIINNEKIDVYNNGEMVRDFTYVDDIVNGIYIALINPPIGVVNNDLNQLSSKSTAPYKIYNIGNSQPIKLLDYINEIENCLGVSAKINMLPMQMGDVPKTWAGIDQLSNLGYVPKTSYKEGIRKFVNWYTNYYKK